jgi:hypothetical protein
MPHRCLIDASYLKESRHLRDNLETTATQRPDKYPMYQAKRTEGRKLETPKYLWTIDFHWRLGAFGHNDYL